MANLAAGLIGALVGLLGVAAGAWLQGRREHRLWLRDQKLRAAIDFIGAMGDLYDRRRKLSPGNASPIDDRAAWVRAQDGRSALYLLCQNSTVDLAEALVTRVRNTEPSTDGTHHQATISLLQDLVRQLRTELGAGIGR